MSQNRTIITDVKDTITYLKNKHRMIQPLSEKKHHTKRHSKWGLTNLWKFCPLCNLGVRCVIVNWMSDDWYRCINCLLKLPVSKDNDKILHYGFPKIKYKSATDKTQTTIV